jgi:hypothetical protein
MPEKPARRLPLRQLLTLTEKCSRDLADQLHSTMLSRISDCRDLSRPVRRRSHFPTFVALHNSLQRLEQASGETEALVKFLLEHLTEIREHARRERFNRQ